MVLGRYGIGLGMVLLIYLLAFGPLMSLVTSGVLSDNGFLRVIRVYRPAFQLLGGEPLWRYASFCGFKEPAATPCGMSLQ